MDMASGRVHNKIYLIMLSAAIIMFGTEMAAVSSTLAGEGKYIPLLVYDLILCLIGIIILERLAAFSISRPLHGSLYAICAVTVVIIYQSISFNASGAIGPFGYSSNTLPSAMLFYAGSALYFLPALLLLIKTGARTRWR